MEIDAGRRGRLTPQERERRMKEGLCFYCGEKGHTAAAHRQRAPAPRIAATQEKSSEEPEEEDFPNDA